jgi:hypothetical protein
MDQMSILRVDRAWRIGLAAVIEETSGQKSYWHIGVQAGAATNNKRPQLNYDVD